MAQEHFCEIHNTKFYENQGKDGKPNWWSHKLKDGTGYCNEKKKQSEHRPPLTKEEVAEIKREIEADEGANTSRPVSKEPSYRNPINRSISISYAKDLCVAGKIELKDLTVYADKFLQYIEKEV